MSNTAPSPGPAGVTAADLTIGYSSLTDRVRTIEVPTSAKAAEVLILTQRRPGAPDAVVPRALEERASVVALDSLGVAKSRNAAISMAGRTYLLFGDDDVAIYLKGVLDAARHLERTGAALALGCAVDDSRRTRGRRSARAQRLTLRNSGRAATYLMLIDVEQVRSSGVRFDERFGAGMPNYLGDEYIFIADLLRAGLRCDAVPFVVGMHPSHSSGALWSIGRDLPARAAAIERAWGSRAMIPKAAIAAKNWGKIRNVRAAAAFVFRRHFTDAS
ncbi:hypothetical protein [Demequina sp.]|uniref:hypothetical protein n=1 Tax=Demequina sp. TaxID=2050685 RepID=UPI003D0EE861